MNKYIHKIIKLLYQGPFSLGKFPIARYHISIISLILLSTRIEVIQWTFNELTFVPLKTFLKIISDQVFFFTSSNLLNFSMSYHMKSRHTWSHVSLGHFFFHCYKALDKPL